MKAVWTALVYGAAGMLMSSACVGAETAASPSAQSAVSISSSATFDMTSSVNNRTYRIFVSWPHEAPPAEGYPVIYMTDADANFGTMTEITRAWTRGRRNPGDAAIVVGIGYPEGENPGRERALDLTPSLGEMETPSGFGGATAFLKFVLQELKPRIESSYPIDTTREALFGHSFGGLFALHTLFNQPDAFDAYLVSSPSIWWGERFILKVLPRLSPKLETTGVTARVLVTVGELEQVEGPQPAPPAGRPPLPGVADRTQVDDARNMAAQLANTPGIHAQHVLFVEEAHGTVTPGAMSRSVSFFFDEDAALLQPATARPDDTTSPKTEVPSAAEYVAMTPEERYRLRVDVRSWPEQERRAFLSRLKYNLEAGLWYDEQFALHEERNAMDKKHGTRPVN